MFGKLSSTIKKSMQNSDSSMLFKASKALAFMGVPLLAIGVFLGVISFFVPPIAIPAVAFSVLGASLTATSVIMQNAYHERLANHIYDPTKGNTYKESENKKTNDDEDNNKKVRILGLEPREDKQRLISNRMYGTSVDTNKDSPKVTRLDTDFIVSRKLGRMSDIGLER